MPRRKKKSGLLAQFSQHLQHLFIPRRSNNHRPKILHPDFLVYLGIGAVGFFALVNTFRFFPSLHNSVLGFASDISVDQVVTYTNQERSNQGLQPLTLNSRLSAAALSKAQDMLDNQYWAHTSPKGREPWDFIKDADYLYQVAGENLARDFHTTPAMVKAWMASPTHKANILNGKYEEIGVAVVNGKLEGFETTLVVQMFGKPRASAANKAQVGDAGIAKQFQKVVADERLKQAQGKKSSAEKPVTQPDTTTTQGIETLPNIQAVQPASNQDHSVLASAMIPIGRLSASPLFTPLQLTKAFFLGVILMIILTLIYDSLIIGHRKTMRMVGHNLGHIILFTSIAFLLVFFKGGVIK